MVAIDASTVIGAIRMDIDNAVDQILTEVEGGLADLATIELRSPGTTKKLHARLSRVMEACAFQDLTGQRLSILSNLTTCSPAALAAIDPLLNGPALAGQGLDQAAADRLLDF